MSVQTYIYRFIVANFLTLYYNVCVLLMFAFNYMKNPFGDPFALKLRLEPPPCLTDPKYGTHKYIKVNNIKLHYVESGDPSKPLMIFVHGFPEFWYSWRHQILEFQKDYWCIAIDMRGYGDSERPDDVSSYKLDLLVNDIRELVSQLGREKCILVSHDWGGLICCRLRDVYPEVLKGIVVLSSTSRETFVNEVWNNPDQRKKSWLKDAVAVLLRSLRFKGLSGITTVMNRRRKIYHQAHDLFVPSLGNIKKAGTRYVFQMRLPWIAEKLLQMNNLEAFDACFLVRGKNTITKNDVECYKYWFGKQHTLTPPVNYYRANFEYVLPEKKFCELNIPFLAAIPDKDPYLNTSLLDGMKKEYKYIETTVIKECGHCAQQEEPEMINKLIRDFLTKHNL